MPQIRKIDKTAAVDKNIQIVIAGGGGFIGGNLARYFHDKGFTRIRAVDKKPLAEWYQRIPGVECLCLDLSLEKNCRGPSKARHEVYQLAADMGGMGFIEQLPDRMPAERPHQHPHDRVGLPGRLRALFLFVLGLRLQHRSPEGPERPGPQGIRRLPGHGRARLRLGEAHLRDVLPGILGRAGDEDVHRPLPQRLRAVGHLGRRPGKGAGGPLPQGHRGRRRQGRRRSRSGATGRRRGASCTSTTASRASTGSPTATG